MSVRALVAAQFEQVAREHNNSLKPIADDLVLLECGLDSLCFAIIAVRLEDKLGFDPFSESEYLEYPVTFGEFVKLYERAAVARLEYAAT